MKVNEEMSFWDRLYIPALIKGMLTTLKHIPKKKLTVQYPEDPRSVNERNDRYRGIHKLTTTEKDEIKCVACFLCATACPADCIHNPSSTPHQKDGQQKKVINEKNILMYLKLICYAAFSVGTVLRHALKTLFV